MGWRILLTATLCCCATLAHSQMHTPSNGLVLLGGIDAFTHGCASKFPDQAVQHFSAFDSLKLRNASRMPVATWEKVYSLVLGDKASVDDSLLTAKACAVHLAALQGNEYDLKITQLQRHTSGAAVAP